MKRLAAMLVGVAVAVLALLAALISPAAAQVAATPVTIHAGTNFDFCQDDAGFSLDDGTAILSFECNGATNQVWRFEYLGQVQARGTSYEAYRIVSNFSNKCMDVLNESTSSGGRVIQNTCNNHTSQQWLTFSLAFNSATSFTNGHTVSGLLGNPRCLDIPGATTGRAQMQIWSCNNTPAQHFTLVP